MTITIAVDVDSVACDTMTPWLARYNAEWHDNLTREEITEWDTDKFVKPECGKKCYKYFADPTLYDDALPIEGAQECVEYMRRIGWRVIFPTTITPGSEGSKKKWLYKYGFLLPTDAKGADYIEVTDKTLVRAKYLLDDSWSNCYEFRNKCYPDDAIIFDQPWNRMTCTSMMRVRDWYSFKDMVSNVLSKAQS
jgi:5'(3')-deoxyribonucleotidase